MPAIARNSRQTDRKKREGRDLVLLFMCFHVLSKNADFSILINGIYKAVETKCMHINEVLIVCLEVGTLTVVDVQLFLSPYTANSESEHPIIFNSF